MPDAWRKVARKFSARELTLLIAMPRKNSAVNMNLYTASLFYAVDCDLSASLCSGPVSILDGDFKDEVHTGVKTQSLSECLHFNSAD